MKEVKITFPIWSHPMIDRGCYVYSEENNSIIAQCEQGETITLQCEKQQKIRIKMDGFLNEPKIIVIPEKSYIVTFGFLTTLLNLPPKLHINEKEQ